MEEWQKIYNTENKTTIIKVDDKYYIYLEVQVTGMFQKRLLPYVRIFHEFDGECILRKAIGGF